MTQTVPTGAQNLDRYGDRLIEWSDVAVRLDRGLTQAPETGGPQRHTTWLATMNEDGSPHVVPVGVVWLDGAFHWTTGAGTRKGRNLARDPRCSLSVALHEWDLTFEGTAARVDDDGKLEAAARAFSAQGWEPEVREGALWAEYSAPSAGAPPWYVYRLTATSVFAFGTAPPFGATRFDF